MASDLKRFTPHDEENKLLPCMSPRINLEASLIALVNGYPPKGEHDDGFRGLFKGPSSVAYLFLRLAKLYDNDAELTIEGKTCLEWGTLYIEADYEIPADIPYGQWGIINENLVRVAIKAALTQDEGHAKDLCDFAGLLSEVREEDEGSNEWFNGRAGYLYLLRMVKSWFLENESVLKLLDASAEKVIYRIMECQRPWRWYFTPWVSIGAVHGVVGIITQIVLTSPSRAEKLTDDLRDILALQRPDGNWSMRLPDDKQEGICQFCHGAPGVVLSLLSLKKFFPGMTEEIDKAVKRGRDYIWEYGLLTKEPCLCHGACGNAIALEKEKFERFLSVTTLERVLDGRRDGTFKTSDAPWSLYGGEAGRAWCWAAADKGLQGQLIGYNDL